MVPSTIVYEFRPGVIKLENPAAPSVGGTILTVIGHGFNPATDYSCLFTHNVRNSTSQATAISPTLLTCLSPYVPDEEAPQNTTFTIWDNDFNEVVASPIPQQFLFVGPPIVESVVPTAGAELAPTLITISGLYFSFELRTINVTINGLPCFPINFVIPDFKITCTTASSVGQLLPVVVTTHGSLSSRPHLNSIYTWLVPKPEIVRSVFRGSGSVVFVEFSDTLNITYEMSNCSHVLEPESLALFGDIDHVRCAWEDERNMTIAAGNNPTVTPGSVIRFRDNVVRKKYRYSFAAEGSVVVEAPNPNCTECRPNIVVSGPTLVPVCDSLSMDALSTTGSGGRALTYVWSKIPDGNATDSGFPDLFSGAVQYGSLELPAGVHRWLLTVTNFLGLSSTEVVTVEKRGDPPIPIVVIRSARSIEATTEDTLVLEGSSTLPSCLPAALTEAEIAGIDTVYEWAVIDPFGNTISNVFGNGMTQFTVPVNTLTLGPGGSIQKYTISLFSTVQSHLLWPGTDIAPGQATIDLTLVPRPLIACIIGGDQSRVMQVGTTMSSACTIDPEGTALLSSMRCDWQCVPTGRPGGCEYLLDNSTRFPLQQASCADWSMRFDNTFRLSMPEDSFEEVRIKLLVTHEATSDFTRTRQSFTSAVLKLYAPSKVVIPVTILEQLPLVVSDKHYTITAQPNSSLTTTCAWSTMVEGLGPLDMAPYLGSVASSCTLVLLPFFFSVRAQGLSYRLSVVVTDSNGLEGAASIHGLINLPPVAGACQIAPASGTELNTIFGVTCSGWEDDQLPLSYEYEMCLENTVSMCDDSSSNHVVIMPVQAHKSSVGLRLPRDAVAVIALVYDHAGGISRRTLGVTVAAVAWTDADVAGFSQATTDVYVQQGNAYGHNYALVVHMIIEELLAGETTARGIDLDSLQSVGGLRVRRRSPARRSLLVSSTATVSVLEGIVTDMMSRTLASLSTQSLTSLVSTCQVLKSATTTPMSALVQYQLLGFLKSVLERMVELIAGSRPDTRTLQVLVDLESNILDSIVAKDDEQYTSEVRFALAHDAMVVVSELVAEGMPLGESQRLLTASTTTRGVSVAALKATPSSAVSLNVGSGTSMSSSAQLSVSSGGGSSITASSIILQAQSTIINSLPAAPDPSMSSTLLRVFTQTYDSTASTRFGSPTAVAFTATLPATVLLSASLRYQCVAWNETAGEWEGNSCVTDLATAYNQSGVKCTCAAESTYVALGRQHVCSGDVDCSGHGSCDASNLCVCDSGWASGDCSIPCSSCNAEHGVCNVKTGACTCLHGYAGVDCSARPQVATVTPMNGPIGGGFAVTILGDGFGGNLLPTPVIQIGDGSGRCTGVTRASSTSVKCTIPVGSSGPIALRVFAGGLSSENTGTANGHFSYDLPRISSIAPLTAKTVGGSVVTITGTNFGFLNDVISVEIGGYVDSTSSRRLAFCGDCTFDTLQRGLSHAGKNRRRDDVDLAMELRSSRNASVIVAAQTAWRSETSVLATMPAGVGGSLVMRVRSNGYVSEAVSLMSYSAPAITGIAPLDTHEYLNPTVTVSGRNFASTVADFPSQITVMFGPHLCPLSDYTANLAANTFSVKCVAPMSAGDQEIVVSVDGQASNSLTFKVRGQGTYLILAVAPTLSAAPVVAEGQSITPSTPYRMLGPAGQAREPELRLLDTYGDVVFQGPDARAIQVDPNVAPHDPERPVLGNWGDDLRDMYNGILKYTGFSFRGYPHSNFTISFTMKIYADLAPRNGSRENFEKFDRTGAQLTPRTILHVNTTVYAQACPLGEIGDPRTGSGRGDCRCNIGYGLADPDASVSTKCVVCPQSAFKATIGDRFCTACPDLNMEVMPEIRERGASRLNECKCKPDYWRGVNMLKFIERDPAIESELIYAHAQTGLNETWIRGVERRSLCTKCKLRGACLGDGVGAVDGDPMAGWGSASCAEGHTGILCSVCLPEFTLDLGAGKCVACPPMLEWYLFFGAWIIMGGIVLFGIIKYAHIIKHFLHLLPIRFIRLSISYFVVVAAMTANFNLDTGEGPSIFKQFLDQLNVSKWVATKRTSNCLLDQRGSFYNTFLGEFFSPLFVLGGGGLVVLKKHALRRQWHKKIHRKIQRLRGKAKKAEYSIDDDDELTATQKIFLKASMTSYVEYITPQMKLVMLVLLTTVHPRVTSHIVALFNCNPVLGYELPFLKKDYTLPCFDDQWFFYAFLGGGGFIIFSVGLPVWMAQSLYRAKNELENSIDTCQDSYLAIRQAEGVPKRFKVPFDVSQAFTMASKRFVRARFGYDSMFWVHAAFRPHLFFWEVVETVRKLMLTATITFIASNFPGYDIIWANFVAVVALLVQLHFVPIKDPYAQRLQVVYLGVEVVMFLIILILTLSIYASNYNMPLASYLLVLLNVFAMCWAIWSLGRHFPTIRRKLRIFILIYNGKMAPKRDHFKEGLRLRTVVGRWHKLVERHEALGILKAPKARKWSEEIDGARERQEEEMRVQALQAQKDAIARGEEVKMTEQESADLVMMLLGGQNVDGLIKKEESVHESDPEDLSEDFEDFVPMLPEAAWDCPACKASNKEWARTCKVCSKPSPHAWKCHKCEALSHTTLKECVECGAVSSEAWMCRKCDSWNAEAAVSCQHCKHTPSHRAGSSVQSPIDPDGTPGAGVSGATGAHLAFGTAATPDSVAASTKESMRALAFGLSAEALESQRRVGEAEQMVLEQLGDDWAAAPDARAVVDAERIYMDLMAEGERWQQPGRGPHTGVYWPSSGPSGSVRGQDGTMNRMSAALPSDIRDPTKRKPTFMPYEKVGPILAEREMTTRPDYGFESLAGAEEAIDKALGKEDGLETNVLEAGLAWSDAPPPMPTIATSALAPVPSSDVLESKAAMLEADNLMMAMDDMDDVMGDVQDLSKALQGPKPKAVPMATINNMLAIPPQPPVSADAMQSKRAMQEAEHLMHALDDMDDLMDEVVQVADVVTSRPSVPSKGDNATATALGVRSAHPAPAPSSDNVASRQAMRDADGLMDALDDMDEVLGDMRNDVDLARRPAVERALSRGNQMFRDENTGMQWSGAPPTSEGATPAPKFPQPQQQTLEQKAANLTLTRIAPPSEWKDGNPPLQ